MGMAHAIEIRISRHRDSEYAAPLVQRVLWPLPPARPTRLCMWMIISACAIIVASCNVDMDMDMDTGMADPRSSRPSPQAQRILAKLHERRDAENNLFEPTTEVNGTTAYDKAK